MSRSIPSDPETFNPTGRSEAAADPDLSAELVREIFPLAPSVRRENKDLFFPLQSLNDLRDDDAFYNLLAVMLRDNINLIREFDTRMSRLRSNKKQFGFRALRYLSANLPSDVPLNDIKSLPKDTFPSSSPERAVHMFYKRLNDVRKKCSSNEKSEEDVLGVDGQPNDAWQHIAAELAERAAGLEQADVSEAEKLASLAASLVAACMAAREAESEHLLERRRVLNERIEPFAERLGGDGPLAVDEADGRLLGLLEEALPELEVAHARIQRSSLDYEKLREEKRRSDDQEDWERSHELTAILIESKQERDAADAAFTERFVAFSALREQHDLESPAPAPPLPDSLPRPPSRASSDAATQAPERVETDLEADVGQVEDSRDGSAEGDGEEFVSTVDEQSSKPTETPANAPPEENRSGVQPGAVHSDPAAAAIQAKDAVRAAPACLGEAAGPPTEPVGNLDAVLAMYLDTADAALAWHLADLAEERGQTLGLSSAVLKAFAVAESFLRPTDVADPRKQEILVAAMDAVSAVAQSGDEMTSERTRALAFASLLQPALFDSGQIARSHIKALSLTGKLAQLADLGSALSELGYDLQISCEDLVELSGTERRRRLPAARTALQGWLGAARVAKTVHQPSYRILHWRLAPGGKFGRVVEAAISDEPDAAIQVDQLVGLLLDNRAEQERFVAESEKENGRPRKDRIEGMALAWFCGKLQEGCEVLRNWRSAKDADAALQDDRRRAAVKARIGQIRKLVEASRLLELGTGSALDEAVLATVNLRLESFGELLDGHGATHASPRPHEILTAPLFQLPGGCQPYAAAGDAFARERTGQRDRLFAALQLPTRPGREPGDAFKKRLAEGAMIAAEHALDAMRREGSPAAHLDQARQELTEAIAARKTSERDRLERLRLDLATLLNLDLGTPEEVRQQLDQIDLIWKALNTPPHGGGVTLPAVNDDRDPQVPPDFPELAFELDAIEASCDTLRSRIKTEQRARLETLAEQTAFEVPARNLLARFDDVDPVTLDDMIAQVQAGHPAAALSDGLDDGFGTYFPEFVEALAAANDAGRGRIIQAIEQRGSIGPLNFSDHDETAARLAKQLIETWAECEGAMRQNAPDRVRTALTRLLGLIGFTGVKLVGDRDLVPGRLRSLRMLCNVPNAERWFLPPAFGSEAKGEYPVLLARPEFQEEQLATELGKIGRDRPCLLILFGRLTRRKREDLARVLRRDRQTALSIDESLLLHLAEVGGNPMERTFTCGAPFGWVQPYTTNPRNIPPEMFFGRRDEMARIVARQSGGSLVYGGRQLGKSALLTHISRVHHRPDDGQHAIYLDIAGIGDGGTAPEAVWREISGSLVESRVLAHPAHEAGDVVSRLRSWLNEVPGRRVLLMLDEADRFLKAEHTAGYPNLRRMKDLMEGTAWHFKVVFAGLHNVRRMAQAPNSPLVHLGDTICIGPLNTSHENQAEARRLVSAPMHAAGYEYDPPALAWDILARVNHYPSLVQVFCKVLIETAGNQPRPAGTGPRWTLQREMLFEGRTAEAIAGEIRKRFQWSLDLDARYDLIAKAIALHRFDAADGHSAVLRTGLSVHSVLDLVRPWWPEGIEWLRLADFQAILDEMVDLGVLGRPASGRYGLRNAQVAQMLGQREEIEAQILAISDREPEIDYDAAFFHRRVKLSDPDHRAPLPDRQLDALFRSGPGLRVLIASPALWGPDVGKSLQHLAESWVESGDKITAHFFRNGSANELGKRIERHRNGRLILINEAPWRNKDASLLAQHPRVLSGDVVPVWLPPMSWLLQYLRSSSDYPPLTLFHAEPWGEAMLRQWLKDMGLGSLDGRETRAQILKISGGVPERLTSMRGVLQQIATDYNGAWAETLSNWGESNPLSPDRVGIEGNLTDKFREFSEWADGGDLTEQDLPEVLGDESALLKSAFATLGLITATSDRRHRLSPLGRIVSH